MVNIKIAKDNKDKLNKTTEKTVDEKILSNLEAINKSISQLAKLNKNDKLRSTTTGLFRPNTRKNNTFKDLDTFIDKNKGVSNINALGVTALTGGFINPQIAQTLKLDKVLGLIEKSLFHTPKILADNTTSLFRKATPKQTNKKTSSVVDENPEDKLIKSNETIFNKLFGHLAKKDEKQKEEHTSASLLGTILTAGAGLMLLTKLFKSLGLNVSDVLKGIQSFGEGITQKTLQSLFDMDSDVAETTAPILFNAVLGAGIGKKVGAPFIGAIIGAAYGTIRARSMDVKNRLEAAANGEYKESNMPTICGLPYETFLATAAGAAIGFRFGGPVGLLAGAAIGFVGGGLYNLIRGYIDEDKVLKEVGETNYKVYGEKDSKVIEAEKDEVRKKIATAKSEEEREKYQKELDAINKRVEDKKNDAAHMQKLLDTKADMATRDKDGNVLYNENMFRGGDEHAKLITAIIRRIKEQDPNVKITKDAIFKEYYSISNDLKAVDTSKRFAQTAIESKEAQNQARRELHNGDLKLGFRDSYSLHKDIINADTKNNIFSNFWRKITGKVDEKDYQELKRAIEDTYDILSYENKEKLKKDFEQSINEDYAVGDNKNNLKEYENNQQLLQAILDLIALQKENNQLVEANNKSNNINNDNNKANNINVINVTQSSNNNSANNAQLH